MSEIRSSLLEKKKLDTFDKYYEDCLHRIKRIKQKNDTLQKNTGTDLEDEIAVEVKKQKEFMETEIQELKDQIDEIERKYRDPEAKNKMKTIKKEAQKQIERNRQILREFINKSFLIVENTRRTRGEGEEDDQGKYFEGGQAVVQGDMNSDGINGSVNHPEQRRSFGRKHQQKEEQLNIDYEIEQKILNQKTDLLNQVEQDTTKINNIINDIGLMVNEQGENLDIISEEIMKTNKNVVETNNQMDQANTLQKKSRKKTIWIVGIILIVVIVVGGIIWIAA